MRGSREALGQAHMVVNLLHNTCNHKMFNKAIFAQFQPGAFFRHGAGGKCG